MAASRTDEVVVTPEHRFELIALDAVGAMLDLHRLEDRIAKRALDVFEIDPPDLRRLDIA